MNPVSSSRLTPILALLAVQLLFGFNYAASKVILERYPPAWWGAVRMVTAAILMFGTAFFVVPKKERRVDADFLKKSFIYSVFGMALCQFFFLAGIRLTTTTNSAIMNSMTPLFTLLFAALLGAERLTGRRVLSFALALIGAVVIRDFSEFKISSSTLVGDFLTLLNCASLALYFTLSRDFLKRHSTYWATAWMFLFASVVLFLIAIPELGSISKAPLDGRFIFAAGYNIVGATLLTYFLNAWTLTRVSPSLVSVFFYFQPVIAVLNAWVNLGERPGGRTWLAMALIFTGVGVGVVRRK